MSDRRVVITGLGILSPLGNKIEQVWSSILKGESGVSEITSFDTSNKKLNLLLLLKTLNQNNI